jgi:TolB protein
MLIRSSPVGAVVCSALALAVAPACGIGCNSPGGGCDGVIAFSSAHEGNPEVYLMHLDGTGLTRLTYFDNRDGYPACSPDGKKIAFYAYEDSTTRSINVMDIDGGNRTRLTNEAGARDSGPTWSSDGSSIAFSRERNGEYHLWVMDADGTNQRRLGDLEGLAPRWSPDGSLLAFSAYPQKEIFVANADGTSARRLTENDVEDMWPSWSPDGAQIAYMSGEQKHHQIWVMNADGSGARRLTFNQYDDWRPRWSPDGSKIVFNSFRNDIVGLYVMNPDGSGERHLTPFSDHAMQVSWCPRSQQR